MTDTETTVPGPTHGWVAERMGYSISGVSLLRSGKRKPTLATIDRIEEVFGWDACEQLLHRDDFADHFNHWVAKIHQAEQETKNHG